MSPKSYKNEPERSQNRSEEYHRKDGEAYQKDCGNETLNDMGDDIFHIDDLIGNSYPAPGDG